MSKEESKSDTNDSAVETKEATEQEPEKEEPTKSDSKSILVNVYDTAVMDTDKNETLRFRVWIPEHLGIEAALKATQDYLAKINHGPVSKKSCQFQHVKAISGKKEIKALKTKGYWIKKTSSNCP